MPDQNDSPTRVTRRSLLATTAAGATLTAGCVGGGGNGGNGGNGGGDNNSGNGGNGGAEGVVDQTWKDVTNIEPQQWNVNYWNPSNNAATDWGGNPMYDRFMRKAIHQTDEPFYEWSIVSDMEWQDNNESLTLKIDNGHVWHNGDPVTAQDVATQLRIEEYVGHVIWDFINGIEVQDDSTLVFDIDAVAPPVMEDIIAEQRLYAKHSVYEQWLQDLQDAEGDEQEEVVSELLNLTISADSEDAIGNGPFMIGDVSAERIRYDRWEEYPWADNVNFAHQEYRTILEQSVVVQSIMSGELSGHHFQNWPEETRAELPDPVKRVMVPDNGGYAAEFNCDSDYLSDPHVRRAVAYLINRQAVVDNITDNFVTPYPSGLASELGMVESIAGDYIDSFNQYSPESTDEESAAEELEAGGYEMDGDQWVDGDGNQVRVNVLGPTWGIMSTWAETVNSQLSRAGFASELEITEPGTFEERYQNGDYDLRAGWWGGAAEQTAAWFNLRLPFSATYQREQVRFPESVEVPWPPDSQDETLEINVEEAVSELGSTTDEERIQELGLQLAWTWNRQLPKVPLTERWLTPWINTENWITPEDQEPDTREIESDDPLAYIMTIGEWWPRRGLLKAPE